MKAPRRKPRALEAPIHRSILDWLRTVLPDARVIHVANEVDARGADIARAVAKSKSLGMVPGFPDLAVFLPNGGIVMFEVKAPGGRLSDNQAALHEWFHQRGHKVATVRSIEDARTALARWGVVTREVTP